MKLGNNFIIYLIITFFYTNLLAENRITTSPLLNIDEIKPSFEEEEKNLNYDNKNDIKIKKKENKLNSAHAILIGLDKITAKSSKIKINIDQAKKFGPLEIKILKCGKVRVNNKIEDVAYMQVKDFTNNENEKVFIFNGWTFSSDPNLTPFDHAIYDLQLLNCQNV